MILVQEGEGLVLLNRQAGQECLLISWAQRSQEDVAGRQAGESGCGGVIGDPPLRAHVVVDQPEECVPARDGERQLVAEPAPPSTTSAVRKIP